MHVLDALGNPVRRAILQELRGGPRAVRAAKYFCSRQAGSTSARGTVTKFELGCVRSWDIPNRILLDFFIASSPERPTEVEIAFAARGAGADVTVVHGLNPPYGDAQ